MLLMWFRTLSLDFASFMKTTVLLQLVLTFDPHRKRVHWALLPHYILPSSKTCLSGHCLKQPPAYGGQKIQAQGKTYLLIEKLPNVILFSYLYVGMTAQLCR